MSTDGTNSSNARQDAPRDLETALAILELDLRLGLALRQSPYLRKMFLGARAVLLVSLRKQAGWLRVTEADIAVTQNRPGDPADTPVRTFVEIANEISLTSDDASRQAFENPIDEARRLVMSIFDDSRQSHKQFMDWMPVVEASAYDVASALATALTPLRRDVRNAYALNLQIADTVAVNYRRVVNALGRVTLVATDGGSSWLADCAENLAWNVWTPSLALIQERNCWSALIGARAASRFGSRVIKHYFEVLADTQSCLRMLDALVGLTAIGLQHLSARDDLSKSLIRELARLGDRPQLQRPDIVAHGFAGAQRALAAQPPRRLPLSGRWQDAFNLTSDGRMPVFELLSDAVHKPGSDFIPTASSVEPVTPRVAREAFNRAWEDGRGDLDNLPSWAFGQA
jgi:hypothetical protein